MAVNLKYNLVSHIFELGIFHHALKRDSKLPYSTHSGLVGCLPAPNIFPSANEFTKGKMFCNTCVFTLKNIISSINSIRLKYSLLSYAVIFIYAFLRGGCDTLHFW